jgi:spore maturation protein CgeB
LTVNRHIDVAEGFANNMRLYEATGTGALLITDRKQNLGELFREGAEVVAYSSAPEAAEQITYYLEHPEEARQIADAGQRRTLAEHSYPQRMEELLRILNGYLKVRQ